MNLSNILVVPKKSAFERNKELFKRDKEAYESHLRQQEFKKKLEEKFNNFLTLDELTKEIVKKYEAVLTGSGDDFFNATSHYIDNTLIIGFNNDPKSSKGNLLYYSPSDLDIVLEKLEKDDYSIEEWTRAKITLNNKELELTTGVTFITRSDDELARRYDLFFKDKYVRQSSTGLIIVTGAGSTNPLHLFYGKEFGKQEKKIAFAAREYKGDLPYGIINQEEELKIIYKKDNGKISIDSFDRHTYFIKRNDEIRISVSDSPLKVIKIN